jgi:DNA polymerase-3 subunit gamma/tau
MKEQKIISGTYYQKYRPTIFKDVLGQSEVIKSLENSVKNKKIAHAYLFTGGRGSGKTSTARIFANEIGTSAHDIYEIDAASNRGIDQIRELRTIVEILPVESDYKVFIIDEVHMLTKEAFNALLKTLEEPPKHVIFILATTERNKILDTIISRCQILEFKKANLETLSLLIKKVAKEEKIEIDKDSINYIAKLGYGSFRDTLSQFQKMSAVIGTKINFEEISNFFSLSEQDLVMDFIDAISNNSQDIFKVYLKVLEKEIDIENFSSEVLERIRIILLVKNSSEFEKFYSESFSGEEIVLFKKNKGIKGRHLKIFLDILSLVKISENKKAAFESFMVDLI